MTPELSEPDVLASPGARRLVARAAKTNDAARALVVASESVATTTSVVKDVEAALGERLALTHVGIGQHAPHASIEAATAAAQRAGADLLVSIGGGSVIDATKFVAHALSDGFSRPLPTHVAIPTTLAGAEFTFLAGQTTEEDGKPTKTGMADPRIVPDVALLDPEACAPTPRWLWAATGIRALDHAVEGITSERATPESDARCLTAIHAFKEHLPRSSADGADLEAAQACLEAGHAASAGINLAGSGAGLSHKLGKAIGATWEVPHGVTSAMTLPAVLELEATRQPDRVALVAEALGTDDAARGVRDLVAACGLETRPLSAYGITKDDVPWIAAYALGRRDNEVERLVRGLL